MDGTKKRGASHRQHQGISHTPIAPKPQIASVFKPTVTIGAETRSIASISSMEATFQEFNRRVAMTLLGPHPAPSTQILEPKQLKPQPALVHKTGKQSQPALAPKPVLQPRSGDKRRQEEDYTRSVQGDEDGKNAHILMPNVGKARILCRLCSKRGLKTRSRYGCVQCRLGFHVECFAVFHHPERFTTNPSDSVQDALHAFSGNTRSRPATRRRENNSIMSFERLTLPSSSGKYK